MKIKDKFINLRCFWLSKCLIILSIIIFNTSCEKENINFEKENNNTKQTCSFRDYSFIDNIQCYDTIGNRFDSLSYVYSQDDFVFPDELHPYEKIEINADSTVIMYYTVDDITTIKNGKVYQQNDTLCFYFNELDFNGLRFRGLIVDHQLRIPGYGFRYYIFASDGTNSGEIKNTTIGYGIPDLEDLLKNFPNFYLDNNIIKIRNLYVQRFDLIYDIKTE
ncbi:hypothetical protein [Labilibaculum euxinus]|uniref:Uncharacterized protein n=1 Tax=Labilibaculum euxinus TaxID=2686357 RepID=A0A7M4D750_9BACT|nr:hypothetical protein [Labilibaculum euxinus]MUP38479.1 hypothetical protein [Labilibaculum euxinus]MVB07684.1 hypothetical protein [Labilibaculum euxinus]